MSIYKVTDGTIDNKIKAINDMVIELNGKLVSGKFDKNEIDAIYESLSGVNRKYKRNIAIGNSLSDYTGWTVNNDFSAYSVWKYNLTDYEYNENNKLYLDGKELEFKGVADNLYTVFSFVYLYDGSYNNINNYGDYNLLSTTDEYIYIGYNDTYIKSINFNLLTAGIGYTLKFEYYSDSGWTEITSDNGLIDNTNNFSSTGIVEWDVLNDFAEIAINGQTKIWVRISTTTVPVRIAHSYFISPTRTVLTLLSLSDEEILTENWSWCSYGLYVYVTLPNTGNSLYEGITFIKNSSSDVNKLNYFIYNHSITSDYEDSSFSQNYLIIPNNSLYTVYGGEYNLLWDDYIIVTVPSTLSITINLPNNDNGEEDESITGKRYIFKNITALGSNIIVKLLISVESAELIDDSLTELYFSELGETYELVRLDGNGWLVISHYLPSLYS